MIFDLSSCFALGLEKKKCLLCLPFLWKTSSDIFFFRTLDNFSSVCGMLSRCSIAKIIFLISRLSVVASDNLLVLGDPPRRINSFPPPNFNRFVKPFSRISSGKK